jgi:hypothetical protein
MNAVVTKQRGGRRPGAGRRKGSKNRDSLTFRERLVESGIDLADEAVEMFTRIKASGDDILLLQILALLIRYCFPTMKAVELKAASADDVSEMSELEVAQRISYALYRGVEEKRKREAETGKPVKGGEVLEAVAAAYGCTPESDRYSYSQFREVPRPSALESGDPEPEQTPPDDEPARSPEPTPAPPEPVRAPTYSYEHECKHADGFDHDPYADE